MKDNQYKIKDNKKKIKDDQYKMKENLKKIKKKKLEKVEIHPLVDEIQLNIHER